MDNGVFALLQRRGNQAANDALASRQGGASPQATRNSRSAPAGWRPDRLPEPDLVELRAELIHMAAHGSFSFLQIVALIDGQPDLSRDQAMQLKEELRRHMQQR